MCGGCLCPSRSSVSLAGPTDPDSTVGSQNKGGGLPAPASLAQSSDHSSVIIPEQENMPEFVVTALLAPSRFSLKLLRALVMGLVYLAALVAAAVYSCIALTNLLCRPRRGCCGRQRLSAPECLRDPTLGEHGFLTLRVSALWRQVSWGGCGLKKGVEMLNPSRPWGLKPREEAPLPRTPQLLLKLGPPTEFLPASALCLCWSWQRTPHAISTWLPRELVSLGPWILVLTGLGKGRVLTVRYLGNENRQGCVVLGYRVYKAQIVCKGAEILTNKEANEEEVAFGLSAWDSYFLPKKSRAERGWHKEEHPADVDSTHNSLAQQVLLALPAAGVPELFPCSGCRPAWLCPL